MFGVIFTKGNGTTNYSTRYNCYSRTGFILASQSLLDQVSFSEIDIKMWTDHAFVTCEVLSFEHTMQESWWVLNKSLLFKESVKS